MPRKFSELSDYEQFRFNDLRNFMKETWNERIDVKLDIIRRFDLDVNDPVALDFLTDVYVPTPPQQTIRTEHTPPSLPTANQTAANPVEKTNKREMTYANSEDLIIIQNRLLHAISHLTLNERRLILFLSPIVRKQIEQTPNNRLFFVRATDFACEYNLKGKSVYSELEKVAISIQKKIIEFWNYGNNGKIKSTVRLSWVTKGEYFKDKGYIALQFHDDVIEMLTVFDKATGNFWTQYQKEWITKLGSYGIVMLEMVLSSLQNKGYYTTEHLREKFDCVDNYPVFGDFKRYVIDKAIQEIHENTPIKIKYKTHKTGRSVTALSFSYIDTSTPAIKDELQHDNNTQEQNPFVNFKMTQKQLSMFATKIKKATGQDIDEIINELCNVHLQAKHIDFLKVLDFVPSDWYSEDEIKEHLTASQIDMMKKQAKQDGVAAKELEKERLEQDFHKIKLHAEEFVLANMDKINKISIQKLYLEQENYQAIVEQWRDYLLDTKYRQSFKKIKEILEY